jgi:hypothetical protein
MVIRVRGRSRASMKSQYTHKMTRTLKYNLAVVIPLSLHIEAPFTLHYAQLFS